MATDKTESPKQRFGRLFRLLASQCGKEIDANMLYFYDSAVKPFGWEKASEALERIIITRSGGDAFPSPGDITRALTATQKTHGGEIAGRIMTAMRRFGSYDADGAKKFIGEIGWKMVDRFGGWSSLCRNTRADQVPYLVGQITKMIDQEGHGHASNQLPPHTTGLLTR